METIPEKTDNELLAQFAEVGCEESFAALTERHIHLVYSVAYRVSTNPDHAQEITQAVFTLLARKAPALRAGTVIPGWLYQATRHAAANHRRAEVRRFKREQEAYMRSILDQTPETKPQWEELRPLLDEAMDSLKSSDRDAIVLRYFEKRTLAETSLALGVEERAGQKRVARALEKLRQIFLKRGVISTAAGLAAVISANSVQAAPAGVTAIISAAALKGSAAATPLVILIKQSLEIMAWTKAKTITATAVVLLLAGGTVVAIKRANEPDLLTKIKAANTGLPAAQTQAKMLIFTAMVQNEIPAASAWCDTLNQNGKLWPTTPTNTQFALNASLAGRAYSKKEIMSGAIPGKAVVFFETEKVGWNVAGGAELLPKDASSIAVAFADGSASVVSATEAAQLLAMP
jgi:RNA polymerase sigma factor (sigma-70 family)